MLLTATIFAPIAINLGYDPIAFAIIGILAIEAGLLTPPFGLIVYTVKAAHVSTVLVEGKILMRDREILTTDVDEILRQTKAWREKILESLN